MAAISADQVDREILPFLSLTSRPDVRAVAMEYFLGLTGSQDGLRFLFSNNKYISAIINILKDDQKVIAKDAYLALVNITTDTTLSTKLLAVDSNPDFVIDLLVYVLQADSVNADVACMVLSNLSRSEECAQKIVKLMTDKQDEVGFDKLVQVFCTVDFNKDAKLHYLGPFLSNLTQIKEVRQYVLDKKRCVIQRLFPFTQYMDSVVRRGGIIGTLKNCCFETEYHEWLLSDAVDLLPRLLLPLAGPEEFDDDDMQKLPEDLQYLEPDKTREPDPDIRKMLVEAVHQLLASKPCREYIRDKNTYVILRELDNWEEEPAVTNIIRNTISILLADEPEPGLEDLSKVDIPEDLAPSIQQAYDKQQAEVLEETKRKQGSSGDT